MKNKEYSFRLRIAFICVFIGMLIAPQLYGASGDKSFWDTALYYLYKPVAFFLPHYETRKVLYETETQYFNICVEEDESGKRHLVFLPRKGSQSIYDPADPEKIISRYIDYCLLAFPALNRAPKNVLFIGLGGGIMPMAVRRAYPNVNIDIVEIDKEIPKIAEKYFGYIPQEVHARSVLKINNHSAVTFSNSNDDDKGLDSDFVEYKRGKKINVYIEDGRVYLNRCKKKYDIVFIDVYNADNIPFQFTTVEFYKNVKRILSEGGVCTVNVANMGKQKFIDSVLNTILHVFPNTCIFVCPGKTNYVPIMINNNSDMDYLKLEENVDKFNREDKFSINFDSLMTECLSKKELNDIKLKSSLILTDDYAPINTF